MRPIVTNHIVLAFVDCLICFVAFLQTVSYLKDSDRVHTYIVLVSFFDGSNAQHEDERGDTCDGRQGTEDRDEVYDCDDKKVELNCSANRLGLKETLTTA